MITDGPFMQLYCHVCAKSFKSILLEAHPIFNTLMGWLHECFSSGDNTDLQSSEPSCAYLKS